MKLLAVETATGCQSVALMDGRKVLARRDRDAAGHHAKYLVPTIDEVFKAAGCQLSDVQAAAGGGTDIGSHGLESVRLKRCALPGLKIT